MAPTFLRVAFLLILTSTPAWDLHAEEVVGTVSTSGNPDERKTLLTEDSSDIPREICPGGRKFELTQLAGTKVSVSGSSGTNKYTKKPCFNAVAYDVKDIAPGRPAITGKLKLIEKDRYAIVNESGKSWVLSKIAPGLREMLNKDGIYDLVANDASAGETTWLVARAFLKPIP